MENSPLLWLPRRLAFDNIQLPMKNPATSLYLTARVLTRASCRVASANLLGILLPGLPGLITACGRIGLA